MDDVSSAVMAGLQTLDSHVVKCVKKELTKSTLSDEYNVNVSQMPSVTGLVSQGLRIEGEPRSVLCEAKCIKPWMFVLSASMRTNRCSERSACSLKVPPLDIFRIIQNHVLDLLLGFISSTVRIIEAWQVAVSGKQFEFIRSSSQVSPIGCMLCAHGNIVCKQLFAAFICIYVCVCFIMI